MVAAAGIVVVVATVFAAWLVAGRAGPDRTPPPDAAVRSACRAVVASREATDGRAWLAAQEDLRGVERRLRRDQDSRADHVHDYVAALLGAPTDGSGRLLPAAALACRRAGAPALHRQVRLLTDDP